MVAVRDYHDPARAYYKAIRVRGIVHICDTDHYDLLDLLVEQQGLDVEVLVEQGHMEFGYWSAPGDPLRRSGFRDTPGQLSISAKQWFDQHVEGWESE